MQILLNGNKEEIPENITIRQLLDIKKFTFPNLIIRINGNLIKKAEYDSAQIPENAQVQVIHMISGG